MAPKAAAKPKAARTQAHTSAMGCPAKIQIGLEARPPGAMFFGGRGVPKKGVNKANKEIFPIFSRKFRGFKLRFLALSEGPGGFRELREDGRNHVHLFWYILVPGITSYA